MQDEIFSLNLLFKYVIILNLYMNCWTRPRQTTNASV